MAEPKVRFKRDDGSSYPAWQEFALDDILTERNEPHRITEDAPQLSFTIEQGVIYPEDKKSNKRDFLMKDKDNKKFLLTEYNDIIYNPANLKFGAIHRNALGRGVVSPIYAIFTTNQNPEFIEDIVTNPAFIKRSLKYLEGTVEKLKTLKPRDFVKMHVWIPCLEEQQKIADFLSSVDEIIFTSEQEVANLETQKKAVMKKIFSQEVRFKKDDGTDFPDWEDDTLGNHCTFFNGDRGKNYPSTSDYVSEGLPFINAGDLDGKHISEKCAKISEEKYNQLGGAKLARNDILYCLRGSLGKMGIVDFDMGGTVASSLVAIRAKDVDYLYMYYFLGSPLEYEQRKVNDEGLAQPNLSAKNVGGYVMPIPCLEEQHLIADFLSDFDEAIAAAKKEMELWKELKKGLLQQMFV